MFRPFASTLRHSLARWQPFARAARRSTACLHVIPLLLLTGTGCSFLRPIDNRSASADFAYDSRYPINDLKVDHFENVEASQDDPVWCWAACAVMVREYELSGGKPRSKLSQENAAKQQGELVRRIHARAKAGDGDEDAANTIEVLAALNVDTYEQLLKLEAEVAGRVTKTLMAAAFSQTKRNELANKKSTDAPVPPPIGFDAKQLHDTLAGSHPLVVALRGQDGTGHVVVVIGATYQKVPIAKQPGVTASDSAEYRIMAVKIWDPSKNTTNSKEQFGGEHWLAGAEFAAHCDFMASRDMAVKYLDYLKKLAEWADTNYGAQKTAAK